MEFDGNCMPDFQKTTTDSKDFSEIEEEPVDSMCVDVLSLSLSCCGPWTIPLTAQSKDII